MEVCCTLKSIVVGVCGCDPKDRKKDTNILGFHQIILKRVSRRTKGKTLRKQSPEISLFNVVLACRLFRTIVFT